MSEGEVGEVKSVRSLMGAGWSNNSGVTNSDLLSSLDSKMEHFNS